MSFFDESNRPSYGRTYQEEDASRDNDTTNKSGSSEIQNWENEGSDKKDNVQVEDNNASATNDGQPPQTSCEFCSEHHSYDTTCPEHGTLMCRDCWTMQVERELSLNPYNGCRCPFCRRPLNNDVVEDLMPHQGKFQAGKSSIDHDEMYQAAQATPVRPLDNGSSSLNTHGGHPDAYSGRRWRGGQRSGRSRGFETAAEKKERRARLDQQMAESAEREARGLAELEQWRRDKDAEEEGKPVNPDIMAVGYDEDYSQAE